MTALLRYSPSDPKRCSEQRELFYLDASKSSTTLSYNRVQIELEHRLNISKYQSDDIKYYSKSTDHPLSSPIWAIITTTLIYANLYCLLLLQIANPVIAIGLAIKSSPILSDESFTFAHNGSFIQIDAGKEWPFNSKREIVFRFKTKAPHGLLVYQTFDHNKLTREDEQDNLDPNPNLAYPDIAQNGGKLSPLAGTRHSQLVASEPSNRLMESEHYRNPRSASPDIDLPINPIKHLNRNNRDKLASINAPLVQLASNAITATASEKLVNSLFSSSPAAAINGNHPAYPRNKIASPISPRDGPLLASGGGAPLTASGEPTPLTRNHRVPSNTALSAENPNNRLVGYSTRMSESNDASTVLSSSTINSLSASLYELYLKLENGRLKIMYEYGSRLNQTYCGKGLNDDRWHKIDLRVDPELNQMVLILDQSITVEIVLSQPQLEDDTTRRSELVFTNSILYLGGLDNNAPIVKNVRQRLYLAQFIGCIGQILIKTDQHSESSLQPVAIDKGNMIQSGCLNKCDTNNYCLHKSTCVNLYSHTRCDCFGTKYEDQYCWQDELTTLTMLGYSTLIYRIYDWRDRHHSSVNRMSMQFKTMAPDSVLFFAHGDLSSQNIRNTMNAIQPQLAQPQVSFSLSSQGNITGPVTVPRPSTIHPLLSNSNYLSISLSNGSIVVEVNFGDQPIIMSNLLNDKLNLRNSNDNVSGSVPSYLSDNRWHNVTFIHNYKQLYLYVDNISVNYTITGKNNHLYFDPSIYIGAIPNVLFNETKSIARPFNLRHKFVGCLKSVYFNHHNILLALKQGSPMVDYRDTLSKPRLNSCIIQEPNSLPLTMRSGKSYLTFQLAPNSLATSSMSGFKSERLQVYNPDVKSQSLNNGTVTPLKKLTKIEFEYKTSLRTHFLAGGYLRDLSYHDLGGFWTLHAREDCRLFFTLSSGLTNEPEQVIQLDSTSTSSKCEPNLWYKVSIAIISGDKVLNITRYPINNFDNDQLESPADRSDYRSYTLRSSVELLHQVQLGGDLAKFGESSSVPFTGCIRRIKINDHLFDSRDFVSNSMVMPSLTNINQPNVTLMAQGLTQSDVVSSRMAQGYVTLDSCSLVNPCLTLNPCKNNGTCKVNELGEPDCDCSKTGYTGRRCQFSIYKQSCNDLYLSGQRKSSYYLIDLDRNGPLKPIRVRCNMDKIEGHIETGLAHNLPAEYLIRRSTTMDISVDITYMAFHHMYTTDGFYIHDDNDELANQNQNLMLQNLIGQSLYCKQYLKFDCRSAPLDLGNKTWMEVPYPRPHRIFNLDGSDSGKCACATSDKKCLDPSKKCNCDSGEPIWSDDSFELVGLSNVGLTKIVLLKQNPEDLQDLAVTSITSPESQSRLTLSELKCYGAKEQEMQHEITFKTSDAYIEVPGWRRGDITFSFRTASNPPAIILYQLATSRNHGYFRLTLISDVRLLFEFIVNRRPRKLFLTSTHKLNNGQWQQVFIEYDSSNLRLTVNDDSTIVDLDTNDYLGTFEGPLFIGGAPSKYLVGDLSKRNGFTGCFRGLRIDNRTIDLRSYLSASMPTVISGCQPSCTKNLCQNGGKCIEYWGSYECECSNPIAHSGDNCEINLNTNSITFVTQEAYYVQTSNDNSIYPSYLIKNLLLNIRTYQETALILYASDHLNNFIQLHKNGSSLVLTFNSNNTIVIAQVPINDEPDSDMAISNPAPSVISQQPAIIDFSHPQNVTHTNLMINGTNLTNQTSSNLTTVVKPVNTTTPLISIIDRSIRVSNTSGSGLPIQVKIERHRLRTTFYVNNNFLIVEKPMILLNNYTQNPWLNSELELVRPNRPKSGSKLNPRMFLANIDEHFNTRLPGFTGCIQGLSIDNQLFDFNRAHLTGEFRGDYRIGCKMHCDSFPCKNQGICIENWLEDRIQCRCDTTSFVGKLCDEDIAATFNGQTSFFLYHLSRRYSILRNQITSQFQPERVTTPVTTLINKTLEDHSPLASDAPEAGLNVPNVKQQTDIGQFINYFDISLAFSTDLSATLTESSVQVIVLLTRANSSKYFLLGLTSDGSLYVQEDYGNSMSLSRIIKRPDYLFNDGYRHMFKYTRFNQSIQITVDHQTYLPTMSVITAKQANRYSKQSLILVGTAPSNQTDGTYTDISLSNYNGCVSSKYHFALWADDLSKFDNDESNKYKTNSTSTLSPLDLLIKIDDLTFEPLNEAFGQNFEALARNATSPSNEEPEITRLKNGRVGRLMNLEEATKESLTKNPLNDDIETIIAREVEQGKCAAFKKMESVNEKRSINEPKNTPLLEPKPIYMDPPRVKPYVMGKSSYTTLRSSKKNSTVFVVSLTFLVVVGCSVAVYAYILQLQYKSEKFRCETPFFHKRDSGNEIPNLDSIENTKVE